MATYLTLARYTSTGMKGALAEGMVSRQAAYERVIAALGGRVINYYLVADGDWDLITTSEFPTAPSNADGARLTAAFRAGGALDEIRTLRIATADQFDRASRAGEQTYKPANPIE